VSLLISFSESPVGASRSVYIRCFAHDFPERGRSPFDPAHIARSQSWRQSLRQYPRHRNTIMLAPQSGQTRLRIAEIKLMLLFPATANEAIMFLPVMAVLHRRIAQNLQRGAAGAFLVGRSLDTGCGLWRQIQT
jgi:hypothetical protein